LTFVDAWNFLLGQKGDIPDQMKAFSARIVVRAAAGDRTLIAEMQARAETLDPNVRAVLMGGVVTDDNTIPTAEEVLASAPEQTQPLPPSAKRVRADTPLEFIRLEDSCEVVPWLEKRYALVPQESDGAALRMVMHHLAIGVAASELERLIKAVFDERARLLDREYEEKRLTRAHQLAEARQKTDSDIAAERAKAESAALTLRETRRTAVVESRVDKVKRDDEMKLLRLQTADMKAKAANAERLADVEVEKAKRLAQLEKTREDERALRDEKRRKEEHDRKVELLASKARDRSAATHMKFTMGGAGRAAVTISQKRPFFKAFERAVSGTAFEGRMACVCRGCNAFTASFFRSQIFQPSDPSAKPQVYCRDCSTPSARAKKTDGTWLAAPTRDPERDAVWIQQSGLCTHGECWACGDPVTYMSFQAAHNVADVRLGQRVMSNLRVACAQCNLHSGVGLFDTHATTERAGAAFPPLLPEADVRRLLETLYEGRAAVPVSLLSRDQCLFPGRRTGLDWIDTPAVFRV
jgi:hypothetical protein